MSVKMVSVCIEKEIKFQLEYSQSNVAVNLSMTVTMAQFGGLVRQ